MSLTAMMAYDIILTFSIEIEKIWKQRFSGLTILWLLVSFIRHILLIVLIFLAESMGVSSRSHYNGYRYYTLWSSWDINWYHVPEFLDPNWGPEVSIKHLYANSWLTMGFTSFFSSCRCNTTSSFDTWTQSCHRCSKTYKYPGFLDMGQRLVVGGTSD